MEGEVEEGYRYELGLGTIDGALELGKWLGFRLLGRRVGKRGWSHRIESFVEEYLVCYSWGVTLEPLWSVDEAVYSYER